MENVLSQYGIIKKITLQMVSTTDNAHFAGISIKTLQLHKNHVRPELFYKLIYERASLFCFSTLNTFKEKLYFPCAFSKIFFFYLND